MLLLRMGSVMNVGYEKIILLYNEGIYETADVISTFVYRKGLEQAQWSYSDAVGLFNSVVNFIIIVLMNRFSRAITDGQPLVGVPHEGAFSIGQDFFRLQRPVYAADDLYHGISPVLLPDCFFFGSDSAGAESGGAVFAPKTPLR